jgi:hypothetical protein
MLALFLAAAVAAPSPDARVDAGKRVCRPAAATIGSRIKHPKVCRTIAEWEEDDRAHRAADIPVKAPQPEPWERTRPQ